MTMKENMEKNDDTAFGWCKCCGNQVLLRSMGVTDQDILDNEATLNCNCPESERLRELRAQADNAHRHAKRMCQNMPVEVVNLVDTCIDMVASCKIKKVSIKVTDKITLKLDTTSKGKIKLQREDKETETAES